MWHTDRLNDTLPYRLRQLEISNDITALLTTENHCYMSCVMGNRALRSLSLSYPKEGLGAGPCQSFFGHDIDHNIVLCCPRRLYSLVGVLPKEGLANLLV